MTQNEGPSKAAVIKEIKKKHRLLNAIATFVIITLLAVILRYLYDPLVSFLDFIPEFSMSIIIAIVFLLGVSGLFFSRIVSQQTIRIIEDHSERLDNLLEITRDLREEQYGDILLEKILEYSLEITRSDAGSILLVDNDKKLTFKIIKGERAADLIGTSIEKGKGISGWAAEKGETIRIPEAYKDERFNPDTDETTTLKTRAILCVPLKTQSGVIGVIYLAHMDGGYPYRERDEEIITYLADQAAISIIKAQFYEDQKNYQIHFTEMLLGAIDFHLVEKEGHSRRVARFCNVIAKNLDLSEEDQQRLYFACLLHDIGFLKIRQEDAFKEEYLRKHPAIGYEMINPITHYSDIAPVILHHHERYDGLGYPSGLKGEEIPLFSRIIAVAEAFDTMVSDTSYKVPVSFEEAMEELRRHAGTQFDARLVEIFVENVTPDYLQ